MQNIIDEMKTKIEDCKTEGALMDMANDMHQLADYFKRTRPMQDALNSKLHEKYDVYLDDALEHYEASFNELAIHAADLSKEAEADAAEKSMSDQETSAHLGNSGVIFG